jgi:hypothetical protein
MAKIEMDLSEYQEIQKVNSLLEDSLKKERELSIQIDILREEKIQILKDAEKTVTIIEQIDHVDTIKTLMPTDKIMENLWHLFNTNGKGMSYRPYDEYGRDVANRLAEAFFATQRLELRSQEKSVVRKGFDEVEFEIRGEIKKEVREGYQTQFDSMASEIKSLKEQTKGLCALEDLNQQLIVDVRTEKDKLLISETKLKKRDKFFKDVHGELLLTNPNIFNSTGIVKRIKKMITELK